MAVNNIYNDIAARTGGDIYIGVVGPVRTGKSTFIKKFMENMVLPNIEDSQRRERATDELPQSSAGKTIMTTEPKFIPEDAVEITLPSKSRMKVRMIDCVGYIVPSSLGYIEGENPRMVKTPWFEDEIPFNMAAEIGTQKVISEHSTIGLVVTTDGSISDIPRTEYAEAEKRVIEELQELNKPFVVLLNCKEPGSFASKKLAAEMTDGYGVPVVAVNCLELGQNDISDILSQVLSEFPIKEIRVDLPGWITSLDKSHWLRSDVFGKISSHAESLKKVRDIKAFSEKL
ncbi:MAG: stage IV sporulation protein A, partial [Clostridia bacterium]|nr:stage IV sporulation protein A [Clostridia bacterium]